MIEISVQSLSYKTVVQNSVRLTLSLGPQFVNYISTSKANSYFLLKKCENPLQCKGFSLFFTVHLTIIFFFNSV